MEMSTRLGRCSYCGAKITVPPYTHTVQCPVCQHITHIHPSDPLSQAHNSICSTASRFRDLVNTASTNINTMVNNYSGIGTSGFGYHSQQARPSPSVIPVTSHGRKRAVLCGVSYYGQRYRLNGTVNDVNCMRYFLIQKVGFPSDSILVLTGQVSLISIPEKDMYTSYWDYNLNQYAEEQSNPSLIPTKYNIRNALRWLIQGCQSGDSLIFHYSGHGSQQLDLVGDEVDGYDETLWPVDHQSEGTILDDEINATIVRPLPRGAKLHAIIDTCHSGTILDLPFVCRMDRKGYYMWEDHGRRSPIYKGTSGGLAISISACDDHQVSVDTTALSGDTATGAMTYSFIQAAQNEPGLTYGRLLNVMRQTIRDSKTRVLQTGPVTSLLKKVLSPKLPQEPQLSSSETFEIYSRQFVL